MLTRSPSFTPHPLTRLIGTLGLFVLAVWFIGQVVLPSQAAALVADENRPVQIDRTDQTRVHAPLATPLTPETEAEAPSAPAMLDVAATAPCAEAGATSPMGVLSCPDEVEEAQTRAAAWECGQHGQVVDELEIDCWHLGGGYWSYTATVSCKVPGTNLW